ncbi:hypothetical protein ACH5RR_040935 [Cinchona calisaya]|uniref:Uncharacterized protein n=1 Tax=Cinchona calisaya TaxID=153742 RepID=A0ABD2XTN8_9GENT
MKCQLSYFHILRMKRSFSNKRLTLNGRIRMIQLQIFSCFFVGQRATLSIRRIKNGDGTWLTTLDDIKAKGINFFQSLLIDELIDPQAMETLLHNIPTVISSI